MKTNSLLKQGVWEAYIDEHLTHALERITNNPY